MWLCWAFNAQQECLLATYCRCPLNLPLSCLVVRLNFHRSKVLSWAETIVPLKYVRPWPCRELEKYGFISEGFGFAWGIPAQCGKREREIQWNFFFLTGLDHGLHAFNE